jgi:hypothetical protein
MTEITFIDVFLILASITLVLTILFSVLVIVKIPRTREKSLSCAMIESLELKIKKNQSLLLGASLLYLILTIYMLYSIYQQNSLSVTNYIFTLFIDVFSFGWTNAILLGLVLLSAYLYYKYLGYDKNLQLHGVNFALFTYVGFLLLLTGAVMLSLNSVDNNVIYLNSTSITNISINSSNFTNLQNITPIASFTFTNITEFTGENSSENNFTGGQNEGLKKLGSGLFGSGLGIIGIALALFALGLASNDKIQTKLMEEEILLRMQNRKYLLKKYRTKLTADQINLIGLFWIFTVLILAMFMWLIMMTLPYLLSLAVMVLGVIIEIVGLSIILYAHYESKHPQIEPEPYTFNEMIQKINDESKLRKE